MFESCRDRQYFNDLAARGLLPVAFLLRFCSEAKKSLLIFWNRISKLKSSAGDDLATPGVSERNGFGVYGSDNGATCMAWRIRCFSVDDSIYLGRG
jgi:hypothetical protein